jgi:Trypsin-like peptidase domain
MRPWVTAGRSPVRAWLVVVMVALASCAAVPPSQPSVPAQMLPVARPVPPDPRVGAVFVDGGADHLCSGAVLASPSGNLILTAAHCLADDADIRFVPGFDQDTAVADGWQVDAVYLDPRWLAAQDPMADYAVARVSRSDGARLDSVAGAGLRLGGAPAPGEAVTVIGYPAGPGGPAACRAAVAAAREGFPALRCDGVVAGFSGAPWITGSTVSGLIGGLDGGGCAEEVSYSPPFGDALTALVTRAQAGGPGDVAPAPFDDGCG